MRRTSPPPCSRTAILTSANTCGPGTSSVLAQDLLAQINASTSPPAARPSAEVNQLRAVAERHVVDMRDNPAVRTDPNHLGRRQHAAAAHRRRGLRAGVANWGDLFRPDRLATPSRRTSTGG